MPRFQSFRADCGPTALWHALEALGHSRSHDELVTLCRTTAEGTSPVQLVRAIRTLAEPLSLYGPMEIKDAKSDIAGLRLRSLIGDGRPVILLVDDWEHWVACVGCLGHRLLVSDSADLRQLIYYRPDELLSRWGHSAGGRGAYYAIGV